MSTTSNQLQAWRALLELPLDFVAAVHVRACIARHVSDQQLAMLRSQARFEHRLLQLLRSHFQLTTPEQLASPNAQDLPVLLLTPDAFARLPRLCGAVWHATTLSREIRRDVVSELRLLLGEDAFALALAHRALGGAADLLRQPRDLLEAIDRDGASCVSAWLQAQAPELRGWLQLRFNVPKSQGPPIPGDIRLVRSVAASITQPTEEVT